MERRRILWFVNSPFTEKMLYDQSHAGTGGWLSSLACAVHRDIDLHVAYVDPYGQPHVQGRLFDTYSIRPRFWRSKLVLRSLFNRTVTDGPILEQMAEIVESVQPDVIHIHGTERGYLEIMPLAASAGRPVIVSLQGVLSDVERKYATGYGEAFLQRFWYDLGGSLRSIFPKRLLPELRDLRRRAQSERAYLPKVRHIAGRTRWDRGVAKLLSPQSVYHHIDEVLRPPFLETQWSEPLLRSPLRIHTTLGDSLPKGLDVIGETAILLESYGLEFEWSVAGVSEDSRSVKAARKKLGRGFPGLQLRLLSRLTAPQLVEHMRKAHMYVMASHCENSPNNLAEAMVMGIPCISTLAGGTASMVVDRDSGLLVQPGDPFALAGAILELVEDPSFAIALGKRARDIALERHDPKRVTTQLLGAYEAMLREAGIQRSSGLTAAD